MSANHLLRILLLPLGCAVACMLSGQDTLLTLDKAIGMALENNFDIRIARNTREQAANNSSAGNAGMLPRVDANGAYTRTEGSARQELSNGQEVARDNSVSDNLNANVALTWTVFDGMRMFATRKKLEELAAQGDQSLKIRLENTTADVITAYYAAVQQQQLLRSLGRQIAVADEVVTISERKLANGSGSKLDLLLARTDRNALLSEQLNTRASLDQAKVVLRNLLALEATTSYNVEDTVIIAYDPGLDQLKQEAGAKNSLLVMYDHEQRIAELGLREQKAAHLPVINLTSAYQFTRATSNASFILLNQNQGLTYGVTATVPLFNGFKLSTQTKNAKLGVLNATLEYDKAAHQVSADVMGAYQRFQAAKGMLQLEEENITAARELLEIARERYRVGASNIIELKDAQATYGQSVRRLASARNTAKLLETELRRLAGALVR
jgi:outer membrane protein